jgi:hypothetical protein
MGERVDDRDLRDPAHGDDLARQAPLAQVDEKLCVTDRCEHDGGATVTTVTPR